MTTNVELIEAENKLSELIYKAANGDEIIITTPEGDSFRLVLIEKPSPKPKFGSAKGLIKISDNFDKPLEDFEQYMK